MTSAGAAPPPPPPSDEPVEPVAVAERPALVPPAAGNLTEPLLRWAAEEPTGACLSRKDPDGTWRDVSAAEVLELVRAVAKGLIAAGVRPGDRVGLRSRTRWEWTVVDLACWFAGAVSVPLYETSSPEQTVWVLADSGAVACVVESAAHAAELEELRAQLPALRSAWTIEDGALERLSAAGAGVGDDELERARTAAGPASTATIVYTSGSTGRPKGCVLTHANFLDLARNATEAMSELVRAPGAATLLFIPLAHVLARFVQVLCLTARARVGHTPDTADLLGDLQGFRPTFLLGVPRVFQKVHAGARQKAAAGGRVKAAVFARAEATAVAHSRARDAGGPGALLRARHALFDRLVYAKLRASLGGRLTHAVSGGASLGVHQGHFFRGAGLTVLEGYGLTETAAPVTVNLPGDQRVGSVGPPLPGSAIAIAADGEVLCRGIGVFAGYHGREEETAAVFRGGWFHTGDLGSLDADGYLTITGRAKEIIVTAAGKNVAPAPMEDRLRAHPLISQCVVVGDDRPFVACLITLDEQALATWAERHGRAGLDAAAAARDPQVLAELRAAVAEVNASVSRAESIRELRVLDGDFTVENGLLTPSLKVKRHEVLRAFAAQVDALYA